MKKERDYSTTYMFSHLEELNDKRRHTDLLKEISKLEINAHHANKVVYEFYKTKVVLFLEGELIALKKIDTTINKAKKYELEILQIDALLGKAELLRLSGDRPSAKDIIEEAEKLLKLLNNKIDDLIKNILTVRYKVVLGNWFLYEGKQNKAILIYNEGLKILHNVFRTKQGLVHLEYPNKIKFLQADIYHKISAAKNSLGEINDVEKYLLKSIEIKKEINDENGLAVSWMALGNVYRLRNEFSEAEKWFKECLTIFNKINYYRGKAYALGFLVAIHIDPENNEANLDEAYKYLKMFDDILMVTESENIKKIYQQTQANLLFYGSRYSDKVKAINLYKELIEDVRTDERVKIRSMVSLCKLYLEEYQVYKNPQVMDDIRSLTEKTFKLAEEQKAPRWMIKTLELKARIALLDFNYDDYLEIQDKALEIAEAEGISDFKNLLQQRVKPKTFKFFKEVFSDTNEGLTKNHLRILLSIAKTSMNYQTLRDSMDMSRTTFFRLIKQLQDMKLISLDTSLNDARKRLVILEEDGKEFMELFRIITTGKEMI